MTVSAAIRVFVPAHANALVLSGYLALYIFLDWISYVDPYGRARDHPVEPATGPVNLHGHPLRPGMAPWLLVAALAAETLVRDSAAPLPIVVLGCAWLAAGYTAAALVLHRRLRFDPMLATLRDATVFASTAVIATLAIGVVYIGHLRRRGCGAQRRFPETVAHFWIGDMIGIVAHHAASARAHEAAHGRDDDRRHRDGPAVCHDCRCPFHRVRTRHRCRTQALLHPLLAAYLDHDAPRHVRRCPAALLVQVGLIGALMYGGHGLARCSTSSS